MDTSSEQSDFISLNNESGDESRSDKIDWTQELREALQSDCGPEELQRICNQKHIPDDLRADFLKATFNVKKKYVKLYEIFDLPQQTDIHGDLLTLSGKLEISDIEKLNLISDLESIITTFSKTHKIPYHSENGWLEVLRILIPLQLSTKEMFTIFEQIVINFLPNCYKYDKVEEKWSLNSQPFSFLRLLLQYHEPELCSYLDTKKITPDLYAITWIRSLLASFCSINIIQSFWDIYFQINDPFMIFYIVLVMLVNVKDELLKLKDKPKEEIVNFLTKIPSNLQQEDLSVLFYIIEQHFIPDTPRSIKEFHSYIFQKIFEDDEKVEEVDLSQLLCLPIQVSYIITTPASVSPLRFFIVDCRPAEQYNNGHLSTAFHLDCSLMLQEPSSFNTAVQALLASQQQAIEVGSLAGGKHLCFLGSGREEEDRYLNMVIAFFLQKKQNFVSVASGGYENLHQYLMNHNLLKLNMMDHNRRYCLPCAKMDRIRSISSSSLNSSTNEEKRNSSGSLFFNLPNSLSQTFSSFNKNISMLGKESKDNVPQQNKDESLFDKMTSTFKEKSAVMKEKIADMMSTSASQNGVSKHVSSANLGKRYNPKNFSIADDDQESGDESNLEIEVESWCKQNKALGHFKCKEFKEDGVFYPSYLILTNTHLFIFREIPHNKGYAKIVAKRPLEMLVQITSKKKYPDLITFRYGQTSEKLEGAPNIITSDHLLIPRQYEIIRLIKQQTIEILDSDTNTTAIN